ncbi:hypothetical protein T265_00143 [Opisthorchis viverrini]|uniref:Uncharacterized protein n=1 Tax=Opisthorchis viverrini TaxID=6198 RepID=A0A075A7E6_OPIVI|nr:hypothetical protein T265_00143 [Opisthorchis viverrini]KER34297.1 hypothetical protein T265_00143 [Opisthorchis viverrini]
MTFRDGIEECPAPDMANWVPDAPQVPVSRQVCLRIINRRGDQRHKIILADPILSCMLSSRDRLFVRLLPAERLNAVGGNQAHMETVLLNVYNSKESRRQVRTVQGQATQRARKEELCPLDEAPYSYADYIVPQQNAMDFCPPSKLTKPYALHHFTHTLRQLTMGFPLPLRAHQSASKLSTSAFICSSGGSSRRVMFCVNCRILSQVEHKVDRNLDNVPI